MTTSPSRRRLFNHGRESLAARYKAHNPEKSKDFIVNGGLHSSRVLGYTTPSDIIQLDPRLQGGTYEELRDHMGMAGIETSTKVIWNTDVEVARDFPEHELSVYQFTDAFHEVRPDVAALDMTLLCNDKNRFLSYCRDNGHPIPSTHIITNGILPDLSGTPLPVYVKQPRSSGGSDIIFCETMEDVHRAVETLGAEYQIQQQLPSTVFWNVQYDLNDSAVYLATTCQELEGFKHIGNRKLNDFDPRFVTDPLMDRLARDGVRGIAAVDIALDHDGEIKIIECNQRWNGSTYPTVIAERLGLPTWMALAMKTRKERLSDIDLSGIAYDSASKTGVLIINNSFMSVGHEVTVLLAGTKEQQDMLRKELAQRL
jgi:hypothetical protein